jgi:uncharacterized protein DUF1189
VSKYSVFQIPLLSFFSTDVYRDVAFNKKGTGFGYLFLLLAVCWLILVLSVSYKVGTYIDKYSPGFLNQFPEITIIDGQASIRESQPYYISDPETGESFAVIDTTGSITSLDQTEARMLMTRTSLMFERNKFETRTFEFRELEDMLVDRELISNWIEVFKSYFSVFVYPFALVGSFLYRVIQVMIYAVIGLLFASICKTELEFTQLLRLTVVALTPSIIINTLLWSTATHLPLSGLMFFALTMVYLYLGIKATTEDESENPKTDI